MCKIPSLRALLTCKSYKINSRVYTDISATSENQVDNVPISFIFHSTLLLVKGLVLQLPNTAQRLGIHPYGGIQSYMWYTICFPSFTFLL
jgi:hypothetical protein